MFHKNNQSKTCDYYNKYSNDNIDLCGKVVTRRVTPKKVVLSKNPHRVVIQNGKSCSTGIIHEEKSVNQRIKKKITKSVASINDKCNNRKPLDYCKKCGDNKTGNSKTGKSNTSLNQTHKAGTNKKNLDGAKPSKSVKQYYKNENFSPSTESLREIENSVRKISLDTIKEVSTNKSSSSKVLHDYHDEEIGYFDTESVDNIKKLKQFRDNNYFECHSAKSRIENKISVTSLKDHECTYRFYLNERLFPVPVCTDHHDNIRCVECHLPLHMKKKCQTSNGTIQAKIKIGTEEPQDAVLFLPVNDKLIMKQRRKEPKKEEDIVFFGIIKLSPDGNSLFNQTLPSDSLALKYQKGYKESYQPSSYRFQKVDEDDVVII